MPYRRFSSASAALAALSLLASARLLPADYYWKAAFTGNSNWNDPTHWSATSSAGSDNAGVPASGANAILTLSDGLSRTISFDALSATIPYMPIDLLNGAPGNTTTFAMSANTFTSSTLYVGYSGTSSNGTGAILLSGGSFNVNSNGNGFFLGLNASDKGSFTLSNIASFTSGNIVGIGYSGAGLFTMTGGSLTITQSGVQGLNQLQLGILPGSRGTFTLAGGALSVSAPVDIGVQGSGTFNHSAGTHVILGNGNHLYLGLNTGSSGTYNLSGTGSLTTPNNEYIGYAANSTFSQSGGLNSAANIFVAGVNTSTPGTYALSGGTLSTSVVTLGGFGGSFGSLTISGGSLSANAILASTTDFNTGIYSQSGGAVSLSGSLSLGSSNAQFSLSAGTLSMAAFRIAQNSTPFSWTGGTLNVTNATFRPPLAASVVLSNPFSGNFTGSDNATNDALVISTRVSLNAPGTLTVGSPATPRNLAFSDPSNNGSLTLNNPNAALQVYGNLYVGGNSAGFGTTGTLTLNAGSITIANTLAGYLQGNLLINGGHLKFSTYALPTDKPPVWNGGTITVTGQTISTLLLYPQSGYMLPSLATGQVGNFFGANNDGTNTALAVVGTGGLESITQSGPSTINVGSLGITRNLAIGTSTTTTNFAAYLLTSPNASLNVTGSAFVGGSALARGSTASLTLSAGNIAVAQTLKLWNNGTLNLSGGSLTTSSLDVSTNPSGLNWSAGTLRLTGGSILGLSSLTIPNTATLAGSASLPLDISLNGAINLTTPYDNLAVYGTIAGPGTVTVPTTTSFSANALRASSLTLAGSALLRPASAGPSTLASLTLAGSPNNWSAKLDLTNNPLILQPSPATKSATAATLANQITSARGPSSAWSNNGISSSTVAANPAVLTLALADNADLALPSFQGIPLDTNSLLVAPALQGDANLDNQVDLADYDRWYKNVGSPAGSLTSHGDFNLDNQIDLADYDLWYKHVGAAFPALLPQAPANAPSPIPEPTSFLLFLPTILLLRRRR